MKTLSVRARLTLVAVATAAAALSAVSVLIVAIVERDVTNAVETTLTEALRDQAEQLDGLPATAPDETLFTIDINGISYELGLFDERSGGNAGGELRTNGELTAILEIDLATDQVVAARDPVTGVPADNQLLTQLQELTFDVLDIDGDDGPLLLVGASTRAEIATATSAVRSALLITVPALLAVVAVAAWILVGRSLRPVHAITSRAANITGDDLDQRVPAAAGRDEIAQLATVINAMLDRIETADIRQRQFSADASHELRTPLATIQAAADAINHTSDEHRAHQLAATITGQTARMDGLINDLLTLARAETTTPHTTQVDLYELATAVATHHRNIAVAGSSTVCPGAPNQLTRMLDNLITNANRHANSDVAVWVGTENGNVVLTVEDDGPGIAPKDRQRVFDRFTRLDRARTRNDGGTGLGLAIVATIVTTHHGTITIDRSPTLGGARCTVQLPQHDKAVSERQALQRPAEDRAG